MASLRPPSQTTFFSFHYRTCIRRNLGIFVLFFRLDVDKMSRQAPVSCVCGRCTAVQGTRLVPRQGCCCCTVETVGVGTGRDCSHPLITRYSTQAQEFACTASQPRVRNQNHTSLPNSPQAHNICPP